MNPDRNVYRPVSRKLENLKKFSANQNLIEFFDGFHFTVPQHGDRLLKLTLQLFLIVYIHKI